MSEYMFGVSRTTISRTVAKAMDRAARKHGAYLVEVRLPGTGYQRWFCAPNRGFPLDRQVERAVLDEVERVLGRAAVGS